ncbi:hypothetical protein SLEP1_g37389 [Rubroshorea leprosula]|uniref:WIYLD domain-containing protein n=1 Tax=Rubroshorea leprosula TaxID=152421 RepID=A0AAV5KUV4_9ROSI|nr:hypothetical protein SLEP1_g37389 [Rubroshorea leprosula]
MAPRGSVQKRGLRRIDAALDALRPMGFEDKVVRRTVANLLKAYGGDAGWIFIEEGYYKLVIDTIVDEQDNAEPKLVKEDCSHKDVKEEDAQCAVEAASPLSLVLPCSFKGDISSKENLLSPEIRSDSNVVPSPHENSPPALDRMETHSSLQISLAEPCTSIVPLDSISTQRKPCYGWISSDEEGDVC